MPAEMPQSVPGPLFEYSSIYFWAEVGIGATFCALGIAAIVSDPPTRPGGALPFLSIKGKLVLLRLTGVVFFLAGLVVLSGQIV
jgi:hypothetical protein